MMEQLRKDKRGDAIVTCRLSAKTHQSEMDYIEGLMAKYPHLNRNDIMVAIIRTAMGKPPIAELPISEQKARETISELAAGQKSILQHLRDIALAMSRGYVVTTSQSGEIENEEYRRNQEIQAQDGTGDIPDDLDL